MPSIIHLEWNLGNLAYLVTPHMTKMMPKDAESIVAIKIEEEGVRKRVRLSVLLTEVFVRFITEVRKGLRAEGRKP